MINQSPTVLLVLDGWGVAPPSRGNAISLAKTPNYDKLLQNYQSTTLGATGMDVGLADNQMSGSEAGHLNLGAGRVVVQDSYYITQSIESERFYVNPVLVEAIRHVKKHHGNLHVTGLMGNHDSPHSNPEHFRAILRLAKKENLSEVYCHLFTDGRDSYAQSALMVHLPYYKNIIEEERIGKILSISGRFYAMDRAFNWKRNTMVFDALVFARAEKANSPEEALRQAYEEGLTDEYLRPTVITDNGKPMIRLGENDSLIFFNLRSDRARQFAKLFVAINKEKIIKDDMPILDKIDNLYFVAMTDFGPDLDIHTAFPGITLAYTLPMHLYGYEQLYVAEREKYAHITYFFNGGYDKPVVGEDRYIAQSPTCRSYAQMPHMGGGEITDHILDSIKKNKYDFIAANYANADMVGHTGDMKATVEAISFLDEQIGKIAKEVLKKGGNLIITADHGNADEMIGYFDGKEVPHVFHTKNPVPFILVSDNYKKHSLKSGGILGNVSPTVLEILDIEKRREMKLNSLLE